MDQLHPIPGSSTSSSTNHDCLSCWVDKSVEKEIQRGKELRELKKRPTLRKQKYDVISIGHTNIYSEKKHKRRSRSPYKTNRNKRRGSPKGKRSPVRKFTKKVPKSASTQRCPMRIAELSVPSKRQCIDTWRNKYHILPGIMIDRLREHVLDLKPVVQIPDAIECFQIHKNMERKQKKKTKLKKMKMAVKACECPVKKKVKPKNAQQTRYLCTIFGHKIAKELNKPAQIILNAELQNISSIVSYEIEKILYQGKDVAVKNVKNKKVQAEVAGKVTVWITSILEESAYKILEDQLRDLEEEVGPVLDVIDDLVDNVVDICQPEPMVESTSSGTSFHEYESEDEANEEIGEIESKGVISSVDVDTTEAIMNFDDYIKNELDKIIDSFEDNINFDLDNGEVEDDVFKNTEDPNSDFEKQTDLEQNEFEDANDTLEVTIDVPEAETNLDYMQDSPEISLEVPETEPNLDYLQDSPQIPLDVPEAETNLDYLQDSPHVPETQDSLQIPINVPETKPKLDLQDNSQVPIDEPESKLDSMQDSSQADQGTLTTDNEKDSATDIFSEDESNKKVKFSDINMVTIGEAKEQETEGKTENIITDEFYTPNNHLLSDVDESWPEDLTFPIIRPSESVSKSVTSLGKIIEEEERHSIMLNPDMTTTDKAPVQNDIRDSESVKDDTIDSIKETNAAKTESVDIITDVSSQQLEVDTGEVKIDSTELSTENEPAKYISPSFNDTKDDILESSKETGQQQSIQPSDTVDYDIMFDTEQKQQDQSEQAAQSAKDEIVDSQQTGSPGLISPEVPYRQEETEYKYIIDENGKIYTDHGTHSPSTDSTYPLDGPSLYAEYEPKLSTITEQDLSEYAKREVERLLSESLRDVKIETAEVGTNTSYTLIPRNEKSTSIQSQSLGDITKYLDTKKQDLFSSVRIKPEYKVDKKSAPTWVTRHNEEPCNSCYQYPKTEKKVASDKNIRLWCKDLENGFDNLELWNGWIEKTVESVKIIEMKKTRICLDKSREHFVRDWLHLKKNVDADVQTWTKMSKSTQEKMKAFRKIYKDLEISKPEQKEGSSCNCRNNN